MRFLKTNLKNKLAIIIIFILIFEIKLSFSQCKNKLTVLQKKHNISKFKYRKAVLTFPDFVKEKKIIKDRLIFSFMLGFEDLSEIVVFLNGKKIKTLSCISDHSTGVAYDNSNNFCSFEVESTILNFNKEFKIQWRNEFVKFKLPKNFEFFSEIEIFRDENEWTLSFIENIGYKVLE